MTDWRGVTLFAAFACIMAAIANPTFEFETQRYRMMLVFDITQSMNVRDVGEANLDGVRPTRLEFARSAAIHTLSRLPCGSQVGVALFTGHRSFVLFVPVEVCAHYGDIAEVVDGIDWRMAWAAKSEVAKGLHSAMRVLSGLSDPLRLVFVTDGHEAPPISAQYPPTYRGTPGDVGGIVIGIGGATPVPIPKLDIDGTLIGVFGADEVMQVDVYSAGRESSVANEQMTGTTVTAASGKEHLSSQRADYLRVLTSGLQLSFASAGDTDAFADAVLSPAVAQAERQPVATGFAFALAALVLLALAHFGRPRAGPVGGAPRHLG